MNIEPLLRQIAACEICRVHLPLGPRPLLKVTAEVRILIIGQAPGRLAHESGVPWDDPSGQRLRDWLGITDEIFYEHPELGLMPMGFCYPGTGKGGDCSGEYQSGCHGDTDLRQYSVSVPSSRSGC